MDNQMRAGYLHTEAQRHRVGKFVCFVLLYALMVIGWRKQCRLVSVYCDHGFTLFVIQLSNISEGGWVHLHIFLPVLQWETTCMTFFGK